MLPPRPQMWRVLGMARRRRRVPLHPFRDVGPEAENQKSGIRPKMNIHLGSSESMKPGMRTLFVMSVALAMVGIAVVPTGASGPSALGVRVGPNIQAFNNPRLQAEIAIAANPIDDRNLVIGAIDFRLTVDVASCTSITSRGCSNWIGVYTSTDGGKSWLPQLLPGYPGGREGVLSEFQFGSDPIVAFDRHGAGYAGGIFWKADTFLVDQRDVTVALSRSDDRGKTWNEPVIVARGVAKDIFNDHPEMAVDNTGGGVRRQRLCHLDSVYGQLGWRG